MESVHITQQSHITD